MKRHLQITIIILTLIVSCKQKEVKNVESSQQRPTTELNAKTEQSVQENEKTKKEITENNFESNSLEFDKNLIEQLHKNLKSNFEIDFELNHLNNALNGIKLSELKSGKVFEKEMLFEDFECECLDKITISHSENRYLLDIYEEFYEEELDWCPESSYRYSFKIADNKISDLKLDFMAG
ncbi:hypothetical protein [Winogradskyella marincola]|uniref:Lipoprotein n=1 Tax=Winogradskyella marincola TaxID=3037795 RepID=A0ABT6G2C4_9FLAO|nr:hypothetical protein [Winogradskyella sp. YYF002]MDG4716197.1 hypothetical protein [Winogradskyella sp. YYF002]